METSACDQESHEWCEATLLSFGILRILTISRWSLELYIMHSEKNFIVFPDKAVPCNVNVAKTEM